MESKSLLTSNYRLDTAERFIESIKDNEYYFFVGNHINPNTVITPTDNPRDTLLNVYYNMIFGKKINGNDVCLMLKRHDYVAGTKYAQYDHSDPLIYERNFYAIVKEGTQYDVFKCLDNNLGGVSTVIPSRTNVNANNDDFYFPTDGYRWKYMYSVDEATADKFATPDYFPVMTDAGVKAKAIPGAIDVIAVPNAGKGYANYLEGEFGIGDIRLNGDPKIYGISTPGVKTANGFYDGCWMYISSGPGAGQFRMIESFSSNTTYNFVELVDPFDPADTPGNTSTFEIYPSVSIKGDGSETIEAHARAIIDPVSNSIHHVEMLDRGKDYNLASASVMYSASVGVTQASSLKPIYSPTYGHGYNTPSELGGHHVGIGTRLIGSEGGTVITGNDYSQWGLIKNPAFKKVTLSFADLNKQFSTNELVYKISPVQLIGNLATTKNANNNLTSQLTLTGTVAEKIIKPNDKIVLEYSNQYQLATVVSASNTNIVVDKTAFFDTNGSFSANVYIANATSNGLVDGFSTGTVDLTNAVGRFSVGDVVIGAETGTRGTVSRVKISDVQKNFNTFMQVYTYIGYMTQGTFTSDEQIYQIANAVSNAKFHSIENDADTGTKRIYVTNQIGVFNTSTDGVQLSDEVIGNASGAIAKLTNKYLPDLVFGSGDITYLENFQSITRSDQKTELFKLVLNF